MNDDVKKNLLDIHFQKNLIIASTSVILGFTYIIGVSIAVITRQINFKNPMSWLLLAIISMLVLGYLTLIFLRARHHIENILHLIKDLE